MLLPFVFSLATVALVDGLALSCPPYKMFPVYTDCTAYYRCDENGTAQRLRCPNGLHFNPSLDTCDHISNVDCYQGFGDINATEDGEGQYKGRGEGEEMDLFNQIKTFLFGLDKNDSEIFSTTKPLVDIVDETDTEVKNQDNITESKTENEEEKTKSDDEVKQIKSEAKSKTRRKRKVEEDVTDNSTPSSKLLVSDDDEEKENHTKDASTYVTDEGFKHEEMGFVDRFRNWIFSGNENVSSIAETKVKEEQHKTETRTEQDTHDIEIPLEDEESKKEKREVDQTKTDEEKKKNNEKCGNSDTESLCNAENDDKETEKDTSKTSVCKITLNKNTDTEEDKIVKGMSDADEVKDSVIGSEQYDKKEENDPQYPIEIEKEDKNTNVMEQKESKTKDSDRKLENSKKNTHTEMKVKNIKTSKNVEQLETEENLEPRKQKKREVEDKSTSNNEDSKNNDKQEEDSELQQNPAMNVSKDNGLPTKGADESNTNLNKNWLKLKQPIMIRYIRVNPTDTNQPDSLGDKHVDSDVKTEEETTTSDDVDDKKHGI